VAEVPAPNPFLPDRLFAWLPDGKWVVTEGFALLSTQSGETRSLTSPPTKRSDFFPAVSPDGRTVAFSRSAGFFASDICLLDLTEDLKPKGEPRRLTSLKGYVFGSAWTPNGKEIIFGSNFYRRGASLWKVPLPVPESRST
jgi:Tol biopolymer transport system component